MSRQPRKLKAKAMAGPEAHPPPDETPEPLQPVYTTPEANSPITLYTGPIVFNRRGEQVQGNGEVLLEWLPSPRLRFDMRTSKVLLRDTKLTVSLWMEPPGERGYSVELSDIGQTFSVPNVSAGHVSDSEFQVSGTLDGEIASGTKGALSAVLFHLINVPQFTLSPDRFVNRVGNAAYSWDRVILRCDPWIITLDPVEKEKELVNGARATRGYAITRIGRLERVNGKTFSLKAARDFLEVFRYVLSFALERWCSPMLLVGLDKNGHEKCKWSAPCRVGRFQAHQGWFDFHHPGVLSQLLPLLYRHWKDEQFREALKDAIYWFIEIHQQPVHIETAVVLGQVTLEMLGWLLLVEQNPIVSDSGFSNLPAADKLKLLLSSCSIPIAVPPDLASLHKLAKEENWQGPDVLVTLRNSIVHRSKKKRELAAKKKLSGEVPFECFRLICWYIELILLKQLGYTGKYSNRLKQRRAGQVELVPWAEAGECKTSEVQK